MGIDHQLGCRGERFFTEHPDHGVNVVLVHVGVANVHVQLAYLQPGSAGIQVLQQGVLCDVERQAERKVTAAQEQRHVEVAAV